MNPHVYHALETPLWAAATA